MEPITERELDVAGENRAIERLRIQQLDNGKFSLIVKLSWRNTEQTLITQRKKVRGWVNLGLLLEHIKEHYGITSDINVTLSGDKK
ncbi:MAG: hypothetical protein WKG03_14770 [Telluria sp.]